MKIRTSAIIQYFLIYCMMVFNGGVLYPVLCNDVPSITNLATYAIVAVGVAAFFVGKRKYGNPYCIIMAAILLISVVFVRYTAGGVGISSLMEYLVCIMVAFLAVCIDRENFTARAIDMVCFFAGISIICYLIQVISPNVLKLLLNPFNSTFSYNDWSAAAYGGSAVKTSYMAWGKWFFTMRQGEMSRNLGVYTEPGNYQIVINSALFLLMFLPELHNYSQKQFKRRFVVLVIALLTCQSTSGYLILFVFIFAFFVSGKRYKDMSGIRRVIAVMIFAALGGVVVDYYLRGDESLLNTALFSKLFDNGSISVSTSTGYWRLGTIGTSVALMISHPLGAGFDTTLATIQQQLAGSAGGALMAFGAALGIFPFIATIIWFIRPALKNHRLCALVKVAFLVLYFQVSLAQSKVFYPFIVAIVLAVEMIYRKEMQNQS